MNSFCYCNDSCQNEKKNYKHDLSINTKQAISFFYSQNKKIIKKRQSVLTQMQKIQQKKKTSIRLSMIENINALYEENIGKDLSSLFIERDTQTKQDHEILKKILRQMERK